ncbi:MAG: hypothetical protein M3R30_08965, partial [Candidatus Eremiobacteraeota bacterium]|nr:hypothetical protein [Candidatus Eremiobacteraeota bacterium]
VTATMRLFSGAIAVGILGYAGFHGPLMMSLSIPFVIGVSLIIGRLGSFLLIRRLGLRKPAAPTG